MKKACVIGSPISHSRSPLIHGYWLKSHGIVGRYEKREVKPEELPAFLNALIAEGYVGCNVTVPLKEEAARLIPNLSDDARFLGSANTVYFEDGSLHATTTDGDGFYNNLVATIPDFEPDGKTVLMLGAGGSARAILSKLRHLPFAKILIANRTETRAKDLASKLGTKAQAVAFSSISNHLPRIGLLVNTTTQGMNGKDDIDLPLEKLHSDAVVADIVYVPLETNLLYQARTLGLRTVDGLGMLLHQAVPGFEKWFGRKPEVTQELYDLVARDIDPAYTG
jgi:shikimate dehydrogenase